MSNAKKPKFVVGKGQQTLSAFSFCNDTSTDAEADTSGKTADTGGDNNARNFQSKWLTLYNWLEYDSVTKTMSCKLCKKLGLFNAMTIGTTNFKTSTLSRHAASADHKLALLAPKEQANMAKTAEKFTTDQEKAILVCTKVVYWLAKEGIALNKYGSLMELLKYLKTPHLEHLDVDKHTSYTSYNTANDLLKSISNVLDKEVTEKLELSPYVTLMTDESTDIAMHHKLCVSARVVNPTTLKVRYSFLQ